MKKETADGWHFFFTIEQTETLREVLAYVRSDLHRCSAVGTIEGLGRRIARDRIDDILKNINDITG